MSKGSVKFLLLAITLGIVTFLFIFSARKTSHTDGTSNLSQVEQLSTFKSERVPLSFNYPKNFPVLAATKQYEVGYLGKDSGILEHVEFSDTFVPNARDDTYGYLVISKQNIPNLKIYIENKYAQKPEELTLEEITVDGVTGYKVKFVPNKTGGGFLSSQPDYIFFFYKDGLLYQSALTNPKYKNSNGGEIKEIYYGTIIPSLKFE